MVIRLPRKLRFKVKVNTVSLGKDCMNGSARICSKMYLEFTSSIQLIKKYYDWIEVISHKSRDFTRSKVSVPLFVLYHKYIFNEHSTWSDNQRFISILT